MYLLFNILHLVGVAVGAGGAFVGDALFFNAARDRVLSADEVRMMNVAGLLTWIGLALLIGSGLGMFFMRVPELIDSSKFLTKVCIVGVITLNGVVLHAYHTPHMKRHIGVSFARSSTFKKRSRLLLLSGSISAVSWPFVIVLGGLRSIPFTLVQGLGLYVVVLLGAIFLAQMLRPYILGIRR